VEKDENRITGVMAFQPDWSFFLVFCKVRILGVNNLLVFVGFVVSVVKNVEIAGPNVYDLPFYCPRS